MSTETQQPEKLPLSKQITYALGQLGWSTLMNLVGLQLVFFYAPSKETGLPFFIPQITFFLVLNTIALVAAGGRIFDAITDPLIASLSDRSTNKKGRRIPFMARGAIPAAIFCCLLFFPPVTAAISGWNILWIVVIQFFFFLFITVYVTPFFALLPELGHTTEERLNLSTYISVTWVLGLLVAAMSLVLWNVFEGMGFEKLAAFQLSVAVIAVIAVVFMFIPVLTIDEKRYTVAVPSDVPMGRALRKAFRNRSFVYYVIADFAYFSAITIINTGMVYYCTVLLFPEDQKGARAMIPVLLFTMVMSSFLFYPLVNFLAKKYGKRVLVLGAFGGFAVIFGIIFNLGRWPLNNTIEIYLVMIVAGIPQAFLGILPNAILGDIAEHDGLKTGVRQEGMFFAARTFLQKFGVTVGMFIFAALLNFGKDVGDDFGIRLSGPAGMVLCLIAIYFFRKYRETELISELEEMGEGR